MYTLGIDLASQAKETGVCGIEWSGSTATVTLVQLNATDNTLTRLATMADVIGIDAPFGWPRPFTKLVSDLSLHAQSSTPWSNERRDSLRYRLTDLRVRATTGLWPLSVSSDRIAVAAMRCAGLLHDIGVRDRSGDGHVFEVYPASALKVWGLKAQKYKDPDQLPASFDALRMHCPWLVIPGEAQTLCCGSKDAFDALIAALIARAAGLGLTIPPTAEEMDRATTEGWIAIPTPDSLSRLAVG